MVIIEFKSIEYDLRLVSKYQNGISVNDRTKLIIEASKVIFWFMKTDSTYARRMGFSQYLKFTNRRRITRYTFHFSTLGLK